MGFLPRRGLDEKWGDLDPEALKDFQERLGYRFRDSNYLLLALSHRSWIFDHDMERFQSNERLEFLGDSVLGLLINETLFHDNPRFGEGELTQRKSLLASKTILGRVGLDLRVGDVMLLSDNEREAGGAWRESILADAVEALLGAVYLDGGLEAVRPLVTRLILDRRFEFLDSDEHRNYKSILQERVQADFPGPPRYRVVNTVGPDHSKDFFVQVTVGGKVLATGNGRSKKDAEKEAARKALEVLNDEPVEPSDEEPAD